MKKFLLILWTVILVGLLGYLVWDHFDTKKKYNEAMERFNSMEMRAFEKEYTTEDFTLARLDELLADNEYVMLVVTADGCSSCNLVYRNETHKKYPVARYFIEKEETENTRLISKALYTHGFPISFIIDRDHNIVEIIASNNDLDSKIDSIFDKKVRLATIQEVNGIEPQNVLPILNHSFRAALAHSENDKDSELEEIYKSKKYGNLGFCNYMLGEIHRQAGKTDSATYYKTEFLAGINNGRDAFVYESWVKELDPDHEMLKILEEIRAHNHSHSHGHNHSGDSGHVHTEECNHSH